MFHMENQCGIQYFCLCPCIFLIRTHQHQQIFCSRKLWIRTMDEHTFSFFIVNICIVSVNCQKWKFTDQLNALTKCITDAGVFCLLIIRSQRQNTSGHGIHNILCRSFHNHITGKVCRQCTTFSDIFLKFLFLLLIRHLSHQKKISDSFKSQMIFSQIINQFLHSIPTIPKFSITWHFFSIYNS